MNFLSHYYFTQQSKNPYFTLGAILPDLLKNYDGKLRITPEKEPEKFSQNTNEIALLKGWELHITVDKIFHSSLIFKKETTALRKSFVPVFNRLPIRPFFLAHVGYELLLDSLLIQEHAVNVLEFYKQLAACDPLVTSDFLAKAGVTDTLGFSKFLDHFRTSRYLETYVEPKNLAYALDQIGRRVWKEKFTQKETAQAILVIDQFKKDLRPTFMHAFQEVETRIH